MFDLEQVSSSDGYVHQGVVSVPSKAERALIWVHGLTSTFYNNVDLLRCLSQKAAEKKMAFGSFNTRGHDMVTSLRVLDPSSERGYKKVLGGASVEHFTDCLYDIDAVVAHFEKKHIHEIILVGHSTGANKVSYYMAQSNDARVAGIVLGSPVSDRYDPSIQKEVLTRDILFMRELVEKGKGDELVLDKLFFPVTPNRFLSLMTKGAEDQFGYGEQPPDLPFFTSIKVPVHVIIGEKDEYLDRSAVSVVDVFKRVSASSQFTSTIIPGGLHSYTGAEELFAQCVVDWSACIRI